MLSDDKSFVKCAVLNVFLDAHRRYKGLTLISPDDYKQLERIQNAFDALIPPPPPTQRPAPRQDGNEGEQQGGGHPADALERELGDVVRQQVPHGAGAGAHSGQGGPRTPRDTIRHTPRMPGLDTPGNPRAG